MDLLRKKILMALLQGKKLTALLAGLGIHRGNRRLKKKTLKFSLSLTWQLTNIVTIFAMIYQFHQT